MKLIPNLTPPGVALLSLLPIFVAMLFSHFSGLSVHACNILACIINLLSSWVYCFTLLWVQFLWLYCFCYLQCSVVFILYCFTFLRVQFPWLYCFRDLCSAVFTLYCFTFLWVQFSWLLVFSYSTVICCVYVMLFFNHSLSSLSMVVLFPYSSVLMAILLTCT